MSINRDNYELFFMLYVDNELSTAERQAVESFVAANEDLQEEFAQLKDLVLPADDVVFENKAGLYKLGDDFQSSLLMHLDGELDTKAADEMNLLIAGNKALQADWEILQRTKLDPADEVIFTDKASLYRKERDNVIVGRFVRWAVAAALIGIGFFTGISLLKNDQQPPVDVAQGTTTPVEVKKGDTNNTIAKVSDQQDATNNTGTTNDANPPRKSSTDLATANNRNTQGSTASNKKDKQGNSVAANKQDVQKVVSQDKVIPVDNDQLIANTPAPKLVDKISPEKDSREMLIAATPKVKANPELGDHLLTPVNVDGARTAGMTELASLDNDNHILYVNQDKVTRTRAGGFLKKMKRVIVRNTNIQTETGFRIAGFEFASK